MKTPFLAASSGFVLCALLSTAAIAQGSYPAPAGRVDANGNPTTESTPAEKAATAQANRDIAANNAAADAQASAGDANYQAQQQQYQQQLNQNAQQQQNYQDRTAVYNALRARYAAERSAYRRAVWPDRYTHWVVVRESLVGERVELINGNRVGTVIDTAHSPNGNINGLLVRLDNDKVVWIDSNDVRYNRADGIVMTNLDRNDLHHMADERM